jgi:subfamily B ATP-binding cassette protein MsbA
MEDTSEDIPRRKKVTAILKVARYNPKFSAVIVALGLATAVLEGIGLTFILPIIELVQSGVPETQPTGLLAAFVTVYQTFGVPFTLGSVIAGVALIMCLRYTASFLLGWFRGILQFSYEQHLRRNLFERALKTEIQYLDREGSDNILNAVVTESKVASRVISRFVILLQTGLLTVVYALIALWISPLLTVAAIVVLAVVTVLIRSVFESGYDVGDRVADANERLQQVAQAGLIGLRDIRIFNLEEEMFDDYIDSLQQYTTAKVTIQRNRAALNQFHQLAISIFVFGLIYVSLVFANLSIGELGLFLFVMFRLGPRVSSLNERFYSINGNLPHMTRTQDLIDGLKASEESQQGSSAVPATVTDIKFDRVRFSYTGEEPIIRGVNFTINAGEFVGFVGQSGAGKSTIVSLLARFYEPDDGRIYANGEPIDEMDPSEWRERIAMVRQDPYVFNDTLWYNLTIGNRDATRSEIERVCEIARVTEFLDELPNGYDSQLGDKGVRLSGGQKQRVALARALLKDADLLILDEATSDLDSNLEKQVQHAIESMDRDYALITIAHRLSTVRGADRIYTMENGQISERGNHGELVERDGKYAELYAVQSEG